MGQEFESLKTHHYGGRSSVGRAPDCDSGCRGFESHRSPHFYLVGYRQVVRHQTLTLAFVGSNPAIPAIQNNNNADVAKLADALDLGSSAERRGGSTPFICTKNSLCGSGSVVERHLAKVNVASSNLVFRSTCGCSSMVEFQPSKLVVRVRFPSPAPLKPA